MNENFVDWKRVGIFIAFAFGIAWLVVLGLYLTGGLTYGIVGIHVFFTQGTPNTLLGPSAAGLIGSWALTVVALIIFLKRDSLKPYEGA